MTEISICKESGFRAGPNCKNKIEQFVQNSGLKTKPCPYHVLVHLDASKSYRVNTSCENLTAISNTSWFVLPPLMEFYYKSKNPFYKSLPSFRNDCTGKEEINMEFIYPKDNNIIFLPKGLDGKINDLVLKIAHSKPKSIIYWYLNKHFIGKTTDILYLAIIPKEGKHIITAVDEIGNEIKRTI
ncbi:MAG: hypothetical protein QNK89_07525 [Lacinutrix sp.]|uniref:hypothetical protein n=1 Tax=Lacinutrix sp. TaxID=1937692 RepID=UPI0030B20726